MYNYKASGTSYDEIILNYPDGIMFNETFAIKKDAGEALKFTYQMHFIPKSPDIIIGKALTEKNTLIHKDENAGVQTSNGKWRKFNVWFSYVPFRQGEDKISSIISNSGTTVRWTDVDNYSDADERKFTFNFLNGEVGAWNGQTVAKFGLSKSEYDYYVLERGYKYWAIADEENNLLFACNRENTQYIYGWVADKLYRPYDYEHNQYLDDFFSGNESGGEGGGEEEPTPTYRQLKYLESTGSQYLHTGLAPFENIGIEVTFSMTNTVTAASNNGAVFGGRRTQRNQTMSLFFLASTTPQNFRFDFSGQQTVANGTQIDINNESIYNFKYTKTEGSAVITNLTTGQNRGIPISEPSTLGDVPIYLFAVNTNETGAIGGDAAGTFFKGRIYECKFYNGDELIRHFVPVLDDNNIACMLDKVSGALYYGEGVFNYELL